MTLLPTLPPGILRVPAGAQEHRGDDRPTLQVAATSGLVALGLALLVAYLAPHGNDYAAHAFQLRIFDQHGLVAWDNSWYSGQYVIWTYSLLVYPLASLLGFALLGALSVAIAVSSVAVLLTRAFGRAPRPAIWVFAVTWPAYLLSFDFPFTLGAALALAALAVLQAARSWRLLAFAVLALACLAASTLAFAGMALVVAALGLAGRLERCRLLVSWCTVAIGGLAELALWRTFPYNGTYPFWTQSFVSALAFSALVALLAWTTPRRREILVLAGLYAVVCTVLYVVQTAVGANLVRIQYGALAVMVLLAALRHWQPRWLCLGAVALAALWTLEPQVGPPLFETAQTAAAAQRSYWEPAISYLRAHLGPDERVEAVDINNHWPALYLAEAQIPLARGWYRQDDFPLDAFLYHHFTTATYVAWLHRLGIAYVVISTASPDFSAAEEAQVVHDGAAGLIRVESSPTVDVYAVPYPSPLLSGPGNPALLAAGPESYLLDLPQPGRYRLAVRWTPYWSAPGVCTLARPDGLTTIVVRQAGKVRLSFAPSPSRVLATLFNPSHQTCTPG
jgi:hypothetical protein